MYVNQNLFTQPLSYNRISKHPTPPTTSNPTTRISKHRARTRTLSIEDHEAVRRPVDQHGADRRRLERLAARVHHVGEGLRRLEHAGHKAYRMHTVSHDMRIVCAPSESEYIFTYAKLLKCDAFIINFRQQWVYWAEKHRRQVRAGCRLHHVHVLCIMHHLQHSSDASTPKSPPRFFFRYDYVRLTFPWQDHHSLTETLAIDMTASASNTLFFLMSVPWAPAPPPLELRWSRPQKMARPLGGTLVLILACVDANAS